MVKRDDYVLVQYRLQKMDSTRIDESYCNCNTQKTENNALKIKVGNGWVIQGWDEALLCTKEGEEKTIIIPPLKGFGKDHPPHEIFSTDSLVLWFKVEKIL